MDREELNRQPTKRGKWPEIESEPVERSIHFYTCRACGQAVDMRRLGDLIHHEHAGHEPIPTNT